MMLKGRLSVEDSADRKSCYSEIMVREQRGREREEMTHRWKESHPCSCLTRAFSFFVSDTFAHFNVHAHTHTRSP